MKSRIHPIETNLIERTQKHIYENSRLACAIKLKPWMNEMLVTQVRQRNPSGYSIPARDGTVGGSGSLDDVSRTW